ncbi:hypothetical protein BJ508DRAFT_377375 [Ascobolus immersus RN42]|uniref:Uncharacterized protein n=1 Tax=Ascobolus immersus RN42 TaxID=1160509 RepID=A0A3N4I762_ASCIM|nr:hypothetical protein BJ508DRAFT_377375 [Ascobolus immersus RN42]
MDRGSAAERGGGGWDEKPKYEVLEEPDSLYDKYRFTNESGYHFSYGEKKRLPQRDILGAPYPADCIDTWGPPMTEKELEEIRERSRQKLMPPLCIPHLSSAPPKSLPHLRRRSEEESIVDYVKTEFPVLIRFLTDYFLTNDPPYGAGWDPSTESRLEFLRQDKNRDYICWKLNISSNDEYIHYFGLQSPTRDQQLPFTYCPVFVIAIAIGKTEDEKERRYLRALFRSAMKALPLNYVENTQILSLRYRELVGIQPDVNGPEDFEKKTFDLAERLENRELPRRSELPNSVYWLCSLD